MTAAWHTRVSSTGAQLVQAVVDALDEPRTRQFIRYFLLALLLFWMLRSVVLGIWSFVPSAAPLTLPSPAINPPQPQQAESRGTPVDIDRLVAAQLFGAADEAALASAAAAADQARAMTEAEAAEALAGIEDGAPETRLPLVLRGVVAASEAGLGQAVIEHRNTQDLYRVGDDLPVSGEVVLAKVMPNQVVIDNGGRYELLRLFEASEAISSLPAGSKPRRAASAVETARRAVVAPPASTGGSSAGGRAVTDPESIAGAYRDRLYSDPQSLADVVTVTAVREGDALRGYRLQPGRARAEFAALGFRPGDLVIAVNGLDLSDPANTVRLYQAMRSAEQAVIDLERGGERLSLTVNLADANREG